MTGEPVVCVYALMAPGSERVRYVGSSLDPRRRLGQHLSHARHSLSGRRLFLWLRSLGAVRPVLVVLERVPVEQRVEAERLWTHYYGERGHPLANEGSMLWGAWFEATDPAEWRVYGC